MLVACGSGKFVPTVALLEITLQVFIILSYCEGLLVGCIIQTKGGPRGYEQDKLYSAPESASVLLSGTRDTPEEALQLEIGDLLLVIADGTEVKMNA
ncbi:hypothetical protein DUI87_09875 [Hirundo rustica rustica]|uniref:Uncharacterized protein n=1 Tax=Hirundo rustica rustica TaxID=333673 RepID=A0A3M0KN08_HIRRU|nr:hypothetical protein DUI87_09875 [Hirundo rustica rustica]